MAGKAEARSDMAGKAEAKQKRTAKAPNNVVPLRTKRMCFVVPEPLFQEISRIAETEGETMTDVFKKSIKWYAHVCQTHEEGKKIFVGSSPRRIETELLPV